MMRRLILFVFVFILFGIVLALVFRAHQGYVLVAFNGWQIETSLLFACGAVLLGLCVLMILWKIVLGLVLLPSTLRRLSSRRRDRKARKSMYEGLEHMAEGRWSAAESELQRLAERNEAPGLNYLHAARAAQAQGHVEDRDRYLEKAEAGKGASDLAVAFTRAELQIAEGQNDAATETLKRLYTMHPHHRPVLRLFADHAMATGNHAMLRDALADIEKHGGYDDQRLETMAIAARSDLLTREGHDTGALTSIWSKTSKSLRANPQLALHYCRRLHEIRAEDEAANVIRGVLKNQWHAPLVLLFGDLKTDDQTAQLASVESWLKSYGQKPELLLVAGRLCLRNRLWGRARSYFESSQRNQSRPEALLELGRLFEQINEKDEAREAYRQGLELRAHSG